MSVFSCSQAQELAREFFQIKVREQAREAGGDTPDGAPYTVRRAIEDYLADRELRGSKGVRADRYAAEAHIVPTLGAIEVAKITATRIKAWRHQIETAPKMLRTAKGAGERQTAEVDRKDPDAVRSRKATSNRLLTVLKAALNHASHRTG